MNDAIGHVQGGWDSIWLAYFLSWAGIAVFGVSLVPAGPRRLALRELIAGAMLVFAGVMVTSLSSVTGPPFVDATVLTVVTIGSGLGLLGHCAMQFAAGRRKEN